MKPSSAPFQEKWTVHPVSLGSSVAIWRVSPSMTYNVSLLELAGVAQPLSLSDGKDFNHLARRRPGLVRSGGVYRDLPDKVLA